LGTFVVSVWTERDAGVELATVRIGFIGSGQMALALSQAWVRAGLLRGDQLVACDVVPASLDRFCAATGATPAVSNAAVLAASDVVFLAMKPQHLAAAVDPLATEWQPRHLVVSIVAGITLATLAHRLGTAPRIIRVMPNTPCLIGAGASAFSRGGTASVEDAGVVQQLLTAGGVAAEVPEKLLDAVTGLSGSGPAYIYVLIEALSDGGVRMGLPRDLATKLAAQTVAGAAQMVLQTGQHPGVLKDQVASPGGTTIAGLHALEQGGFRGTVINAVQAATERATQLAGG
jgi:pyrroline-5-carboxylate reductase